MHKEVAHYKYTYDRYNIHSLRLIMILNYFIHYCSIYTILKHTEVNCICETLSMNNSRKANTKVDI